MILEGSTTLRDCYHILFVKPIKQLLVRKKSQIDRDLNPGQLVQRRYCIIMLPTGQLQVTTIIRTMNSEL